MALTEINIAQNLLTGGVDTLFTATEKTIVADWWITNLNSVDELITLWIDSDGSAATDTEALLKGYSIPPNDFIHYRGYIVLAVGGTVKAQSGNASAISILISGAEIT